MVIRNEIRRGFYLDSVALMRAARTIAMLPGVEEAGLMIGTPANKEVLRAALLLNDIGAQAGPGDLILALRANDASAAQSAMREAQRLLDRPRQVGGAAQWLPRTLRGAIKQMPDANLALISVPGPFAAAEARKALRRGLNAMIFSNNVPLGQEVALKREARDLGRIIMGPDCGTAIIAGVPLAFANCIPRGDVGIIGASGTGMQEVCCLIGNGGRGISHAIGTGGRDLSAEVGGISTLMAIDLFDQDAATKHVVLISKPPAEEVASIVLARLKESPKPCTVCFIGAEPPQRPIANVRFADTLAHAAEIVLGRSLPNGSPAASPRGGRLIRGLFCGGTLCAEAQAILRRFSFAVASNVPISGAAPLGGNGHQHVLIDLGDEEFTRGMPHPMIEPAAREASLKDALVDKTVGIVLLDVILGWGSHPDPAGELARALAGRSAEGPLIVASVTGTERDPQVRSVQVRKLVDVGVTVAASNAAAAAMACRSVG